MDNQNNYSNNNYNNVNGYYFTGGNNQPVNTPPDNYKKGIKVGMAVGALSVLIVCAIAAAIFFAVRFTKTGSIGGNKLVLGDDVVKKVNDIMSLIDKNCLFEYDSDQLKEYVYKGLVKGLGDQYSDYYTAEEYKMLTQRNDGVAFYGVNLVYTYDENTNQFVVQEVDPEGPAGKAGIQSGDVIIKIDGEDITNKNLTSLSDYIRGEEGSEVSMTVLRNGASLDFKMNRAAVESRNVTAYVCKGDVGYMYIAHFDAALTEQFNEAYDDLISKGVKSIIFDLRGNPGGRLDVLGSVLERLIPSDTYLLTKNVSGDQKELKTTTAEKLEIPAVVLINEGTASAAEAFTGCLQDYGYAYVIGTQSYGKGVVQSIVGMKDGSALKITTNDYYTPKGRNINGVGITPDKVVELDETKKTENNIDTQFEAAYSYLLNLQN